jgi:hypothetical protein
MLRIARALAVIKSGARPSERPGGRARINCRR